MKVDARGFETVWQARAAERLLTSLVRRGESETLLVIGRGDARAAAILAAHGHLTLVRPNVYTLAAPPPLLCRRCYVPASRELLAAITHRSKMTALAGASAPVDSSNEAAREAARAKSEVEWQSAATAMGLTPPTTEFECPECGRWTRSVDAYAEWQRIVNAPQRPSSAVFQQLPALAGSGALRVAHLQRDQGLTYEEAVAVLATAAKLAIVDERGKGYVRSIPRCAPCYQRREQSLGEPERRLGPREPIGPQLRFRVLQRDGFRCVYCGTAARDGAVLHLDHVVPVAAGGETTEDNLVTACASCNLGKSATSVLPGGG